MPSPITWHHTAAIVSRAGWGLTEHQHLQRLESDAGACDNDKREEAIMQGSTAKLEVKIRPPHRRRSGNPRCLGAQLRR
jgi:hypothetical protein